MALSDVCCCPVLAAKGESVRKAVSQQSWLTLAQVGCSFFYFTPPHAKACELQKRLLLCTLNESIYFRENLPAISSPCFLLWFLLGHLSQEAAHAHALVAEGWSASVPELLYSLLLVLHATELLSVLPCSESQYFLVNLVQILTMSKLHRVYPNSSEGIYSHWPVHTCFSGLAQTLFFHGPESTSSESGPKIVPAKAGSG